VIPLVAFRINWAISVGWDMSEAWLEESEIVVAFICFAKRCSREGREPSAYFEIFPSINYLLSQKEGWMP